MAQEYVLSDGSLVDLSDYPKQFVKVANVKQLSRLVRNCESVEADMPSIGLVKLVKSNFLDLLSTYELEEKFVVTFDGIQLVVHGRVMIDRALSRGAGRDE